MLTENLRGVLVGYARVSSEDQDLTIQLEALAEVGCEKVFSEKRSGTTTEGRSELERALEYVREGDVLVVTRLDRLARSVVDLRRIVSMLQDKGVEFKCIQQGFDTTRPEGRLMLSILGAFAEFETDIRKERQAEGIERAKAEGRYKGRSSTKARPEDIRNARMLDGQSAAEIAKRFRISTDTVYRHTPGLWGESPFKGG